VRAVLDRQSWWLRFLAMISTLVATSLLAVIPAAATPATGVGVSVRPDELTALVVDGRSEVRPVLSAGPVSSGVPSLANWRMIFFVNSAGQCLRAVQRGPDAAAQPDPLSGQADTVLSAAPARCVS
jgi:hypothetical protein